MNIGVFGGSFDPVHYGHIAMAESAARAAGLERVLFMPAHIQPFKPEAGVSEGRHRLAMLKLALEGRRGLYVTDVELREKGVSYTINSLRTVRGAFPRGTGLFFILGADMYFMLEKWRMADELLREFSFITGARPGSENEQLELYAERLRQLYGTVTVVMENDELDVSSSQIRERIRLGEAVSDCLPAPVERYIHEERLYR